MLYSVLPYSIKREDGWPSLNPPLDVTALLDQRNPKLGSYITTDLRISWKNLSSRAMPVSRGIKFTSLTSSHADLYAAHGFGNLDSSTRSSIYIHSRT
jgi:hypothetical protein